MLSSSYAASPASTGWLRVSLGVPPAEVRNQLARYVAAQVEQALQVHGALPRPGYVPDDPEEVIRDQLYRARQLGWDGLTLCFESLNPIVDEAGLAERDAAALSDWERVARERPLLVELPEPGPGGHLDASAASRAETIAAPRSGLAPRLLRERDEGLGAPEEATPDQGSPGVVEAVVESRHLDRFEDELEPQQLEPQQLEQQQLEQHDESAEEVSWHHQPASSKQLSWLDASGTYPRDALDSVEALLETGGAVGFESLETLFVEHYARVESLLARGAEGALAEQLRIARDAFRTDFEHCYGQCWEQLIRGTNRPAMVLDAPSLGVKLARRHGAARVQLLLVDAMRHDVGELASAKLSLQLTGSADLVEQGLLWAALPTVTGTQLELLAKGADGLRNFEGTLTEEELISYSAARRPRGLRAGPFTLSKLDAVQIGLSGKKSMNAEGLNALAADVAVSAARFVKAQSPGTLVLLFGDHGFRLEDCSSGGAWPEEVLVPFYAWLRPREGAATPLPAATDE